MVTPPERPDGREPAGDDAGTQFRRAMFPETDGPRGAAEHVVVRVAAGGRWARSNSTTIALMGLWYASAAYRQADLRRHPGRDTR